MTELAITVLENGPYMVDGMPTLRAANGEALETKERYFLCRCGGSSNKPFCNGTHNTNGFDGTEVADRSQVALRRVAYRGDGITVFDDRSICAHAGCCSDGLPQVFSTKRSPWIDASAAGVEELVRVIRQCPSGALAYALEGTEDQVTATGESGIQAWTDGPYVVRGGVSLSRRTARPTRRASRTASAAAARRRTSRSATARTRTSASPPDPSGRPPSPRAAASHAGSTGVVCDGRRHTFSTAAGVPFGGFEP